MNSLCLWKSRLWVVRSTLYCVLTKRNRCTWTRRGQWVEKILLYCSCIEIICNVQYFCNYNQSKEFWNQAHAFHTRKQILKVIRFAIVLNRWILCTTFQTKRLFSPISVSFMYSIVSRKANLPGQWELRGNDPKSSFTFFSFIHLEWNRPYKREKGKKVCCSLCSASIFRLFLCILL